MPTDDGLSCHNARRAMKLRKLRTTAYLKWGWQKKAWIWTFGFSVFFALMSWPMLSSLPKPEKVDVATITAKGTRTDAIVKSIRENRSISVNGQNPILIGLVFSDAGTERFVEHQTMDFAYVSTLSVGNAVPILYYQGKAVIDGIGYYRFPYGIFNLFYVIPVVFTVIPGIYLVWFFRRKVKLYTVGLESQAVVESLEPLYFIRSIGFRSLSKHQYRVYYSFIDQNENVVTGSEVITDKLKIDSLSKDSVLDILYLDSDPEINCLYEKFLVKQSESRRGAT
ncbi:MAG: hypothetical protein JJU00_11925 [Opitutales bacterium]|nr:hypothetical protein [Opitutales bacterium]